MRGFSGPFLDGIEGDAGTVTGISLPLFRSLLTELDVAVVSLWR
jgi:septum formation protein